ASTNKTIGNGLINCHKSRGATSSTQDRVDCIISDAVTVFTALTNVANITVVSSILLLYLS
ncbi:MAG: hypothetical protein M1830_006518, partial [Pleopsidium flavum]